MIDMLAKLNDPSLKAQMKSLIAAYDDSGWFHADIHSLIASWYMKNNDSPKAGLWYHRLADSQGYGEQWGLKNACTTLGKYYLEHGEIEKGRSYLWREALYSHDAAANQIKLMNVKK